MATTLLLLRPAQDTDNADAAFIAEQMVASALEFGSSEPFGLVATVSSGNTQHGWRANARHKVALSTDPTETGAMLWIATDDTGERVGSIGILPSRGSSNGQVAEFVSSRWAQCRQPQIGQLVSFYVHQSARGQGVGRLLMDRAISFAQDVGYDALSLTVFRCLTAARRFYTATEFEVVASYHAPGHCDEDDIMVKLLPPRIELVYFDIHARGECVRLLFAAAGRERELVDTRLPLFLESPAARHEWVTQHKPQSPMGFVPYLLIGPVGGCVTIPGALASVNFVARHLGLAGETGVDAAICESVVSTCLELLTPRLTELALRTPLAVDPASSAAGAKAQVAMAAELGLLKEPICNFCDGTVGSTGQALRALEKFVNAGLVPEQLEGCPRWVIGAEVGMTVADLAIFNTLDECIQGPRGDRDCLGSAGLVALRLQLPVLMATYDLVTTEMAKYLATRRTESMMMAITTKPKL